MQESEFTPFSSFLDDSPKPKEFYQKKQQEIIISKIKTDESGRSTETKPRHYIPTLGKEHKKIRQEMTQMIDDAFVNENVWMEKQPPVVSNPALEANELKILEINRSKQIIFKKQLFDQILQKERRNPFNYLNAGEDEEAKGGALERLDIGRFGLADRKLGGLSNFSREMLQVLEADFRDVNSDFQEVKKLFAQTKKYQNKDSAAQKEFQDFESKLAGLKNHKIAQIVEATHQTDDHLEKYLRMLEDDAQLDSRKLLNTAGSSETMQESQETLPVEVTGEQEHQYLEEDGSSEIASLLDLSENLKSNMSYQTKSMRSNALLFANPYDFSQLTLLEKKNYLKGSVDNHYKLFSLIRDQMRHNLLDHETAIAAYQKLAMIIIKKHDIYDKPDMAEISITKHSQYKPFLSLCISKISKMDLSQFARFIYCFGVIHEQDSAQTVDRELAPKMLKSVSSFLALRFDLNPKVSKKLEKKQKKIVASDLVVSEKEVKDIGVILKSVMMFGRNDYYFFRSSQITSFVEQFIPKHSTHLLKDPGLIDKYLGFFTLAFRYNQDNASVTKAYSQLVSQVVFPTNFFLTKPYTLPLILDSLMALPPSLLEPKEVGFYFAKVASDISQGVLNVNMDLANLALLNSAMSMQKNLPDSAFQVSRNYFLKNSTSERSESQTLVVNAQLISGFEFQRFNKGMLGNEAPPKPVEMLLIDCLFNFKTQGLEGQDKYSKYKGSFDKFLQILEFLEPEELVSVLQMALLFGADQPSLDLVQNAIAMKLEIFGKQEVLLLSIINSWKSLPLISGLVKEQTYRKLFSVSPKDLQGVPESPERDIKIFTIFQRLKNLSISELFYFIFSHQIETINLQFKREDQLLFFE